MDRYLDAMDAYYNLISEFPDTKHKRAAERMLRACKNFLAKHNAGEIESDGSAVVGESKLNTNITMQ